MARLPNAASVQLETCLERARTEQRADNPGAMWQLLEDAHVLSQPSARQHVRVHYRMLLAGLQTRDHTEVRGQLTRLLVAAPGSWTGRYPRGNTGRARVPATKPMPVRPELEALLTEPEPV